MSKRELGKHDEGPRSPRRRRLLIGGGGVALGALAASATAAPAAAAQVDQVMQKPPACDQPGQQQNFYGFHQAGIVTPAPAAGLVVAFDVLATTRDDLARLFRRLNDRIAFLMGGGTPPALDPRYPPPDSGILGPVVVPDNLTVTVAVGASLFDERFGLQAAKPLHLERMPHFPNDTLDADCCHGDLLLQFCASAPEGNIHALRDILKNLPDLLMLRWQLDGFLPTTADAGHKHSTPRNLLGFKDGTANLKPDDTALMDSIVWVQPGGGEPDWAVGGSYQVVRIVRNFVERWDRTPLREQEDLIGRDKASGAPLGMAHEHDEPDYADDPQGKRTPLTAHIRLANPRTRETQASLILRRPFNYSRGITKAGQLDMGLLFICFQANLQAGFATVQARLNGEPLEEYIKPTGGGYFFVLPGVPDADRYLGQGLIEAA